MNATTNKPKVSIIVPIHNEEKYLEECLHSLFLQSLDDIEYIFINDGSTDSSMVILKEIVNKYPHRIHQVVIFDLEKTSGISEVRNYGLERARGEYIGWVDSDDWISTEMFEKMYSKAKVNNSDIVWIDYYNEKATGQELRRQVCEEDQMSCITSYLECQWKIASGLQFKLAKRDLYKQISFVPGQNIAEDLYASIMLFSHAKSVSYLAEPLYHYRYDSSTSMSAVTTKEKVIKGKKELIQNFKLGVDQMEASETSVYNPKSLEYAKLYIRDKVLSYFGANAWKECYPECSDFKKLKNLSKFKRLNYWCLSHGFKGYNSILDLVLHLKNELTGYKLR